jgi:hypothetical protein
MPSKPRYLCTVIQSSCPSASRRGPRHTPRAGTDSRSCSCSPAPLQQPRPRLCSSSPALARPGRRHQPRRRGRGCGCGNGRGAGRGAGQDWGGRGGAGAAVEAVGRAAVQAPVVQVPPLDGRGGGAQPRAACGTPAAHTLLHGKGCTERTARATRMRRRASRLGYWGPGRRPGRLNKPPRPV